MSQADYGAEYSFGTNLTLKYCEIGVFSSNHDPYKIVFIFRLTLKYLPTAFHHAFALPRFNAIRSYTKKQFSA